MLPLTIQSETFRQHDDWAHLFTGLLSTQDIIYVNKQIISWLHVCVHTIFKLHHPDLNPHLLGQVP